MGRTKSVSSVPAPKKPSRHVIREKLVILHGVLLISDSSGQNHGKVGYYAASPNTETISLQERRYPGSIPDQALRMSYIKTEATLGSNKMWLKPSVHKNSLMCLIHYSNKNKKVPGEMWLNQVQFFPQAISMMLKTETQMEMNVQVFILNYLL